ncbi:hypothetical protein J1N35_035023 [Gossypium stocksii]|uniref:Uncharacterized protein n=1 Tax=Gossypium stocksii TaxID=47602 RepID=A0A9D3UT42_9ROSI|nr:hypothetical protein J1N35_035023 [Gossypium stocksii]
MDVIGTSVFEFIYCVSSNEMRHNEEIEKEIVEKKNISVSLKYTMNNENKSSDEVEWDKEMAMFAKRFMKSNKGKRF